MTSRNLSSALRTGRIKENFRGRLVRLSYGRHWEWKGIEGKMHDLPWGGSEVIPRLIAAHFAEDYVKLLTGQDIVPDFLLGEGVSQSRWERKVGEWVYFIELRWEASDV